MDREDPWSALTLDRYWDAVLRQGVTRAHPPDIAPEDAAMIARVQSLGPRRPLFPNPQRAWHDLLERPDAPGMETRFTGGPSHLATPRLMSLPDANGRVSGEHVMQAGSPARIPPPASWSRRGLPYLATTLLVLLVVAIGNLTLRPRPAQEQPAMLQASIGSPEPTATTTTQAIPLVDVPVPMQAMPGGNVIGSALAHQTILPDTNSTWDQPALRVEYVLEGTYRVRSNGPTQVIRAGTDATPEAVAVGSEIVMGPGDAMVAWGETASDYANPGSSPVELLSWILTPGPDSSDPTPDGWVSNDVMLQPGLEGRMGAARVRLLQVKLPPDGRFSPPPNALQMSVTLPANAQGTLVAPSVATQRDGTVLNLGPEPTTVYVLDLEMMNPWDAWAGTGTAEPLR